MQTQELIELKDSSLLRTKALIAGAWQDADDGATFEIHDPATGEALAAVPKMGAAETRRAIEAANSAWHAWRKQPAKARAAVLRKWCELMIANADDLASIMTAEQGKPLAEAKGEINYAASFLEWFGEEAKRVYGDAIPSPAVDKRIVVVKEPVGVCAASDATAMPLIGMRLKFGRSLRCASALST